MPDEPMLQVRLRHSIHPGLMLDVDLTLGCVCGILFGRSGAGKTSLLRLIAGLDRPKSGSIQLGGETLFDSTKRIDHPLRSRRIGMVFQDDLLFPHLSVNANIRYGLRAWGRTEADARVDTVAALCGVEALLSRSPTTLSGGERQRVGLARALAPRPKLLLCDEPVSALDHASRDALIDRLKAVQSAEALPLLYVTHNPTDAIALGSTLFLLDEGKIVASGLPLDVLAAASGRMEGVRNEFRAQVTSHADDGGGSVLALAGGPELVVPRQPYPVGALVMVSVLAEEILLARVPVLGLSARNVLEGAVERIVEHGAEAEVLVRTGALVWVVSVVAPAVAALGLGAGAEVRLIIKARSCSVREA
jgi:molybdate transport system ATP-binding protein